MTTSTDNPNKNRMATWLRHVATTALSAVLVVAPGLSVSDEMGGSCSVGGLINDPLFDLKSLGGVTLNKTLTLLNGLDQIKGAAYDPAKGEVVFMGEGVVPVAEKIDIDDLVVAMRSVFVNVEDPGITFATADKAKAFANKKWDITYFGATPNE